MKDRSREYELWEYINTTYTFVYILYTCMAKTAVTLLARSRLYPNFKLFNIQCFFKTRFKRFNEYFSFYYIFDIIARFHCLSYGLCNFLIFTLKLSATYREISLTNLSAPEIGNWRALKVQQCGWAHRKELDVSNYMPLTVQLLYALNCISIEPNFPTTYNHHYCWGDSFQNQITLIISVSLL